MSGAYLGTPPRNDRVYIELLPGTRGDNRIGLTAGLGSDTDRHPVINDCCDTTSRIFISGGEAPLCYIEYRDGSDHAECMVAE